MWGGASESPFFWVKALHKYNMLSYFRIVCYVQCLSEFYLGATGIWMTWEMWQKWMLIIRILGDGVRSLNFNKFFRWLLCTEHENCWSWLPLFILCADKGSNQTQFRNCFVSPSPQKIFCKAHLGHS